MQKLLEISDLSISFGSRKLDKCAVKAVNFELLRGETLGIVGESGSGKSLTCLSAIGLLPDAARIVSGKISYYGKNGEVELNRLSEKAWRRYRGNDIAMIFQEPMSSLNPVYTCGSQIVEMLRAHRSISASVAKKKAIELLTEVKIKNAQRIFESYPHQISGGQKQRVMIALAMACNPSILIADEPTTALDVTVQKSILELMKNLQEKHGNGIIFVSHDLSVVAEVADKVAVMYQGEIVEYGKTVDIFKNPQNPYTKGLLACRPPLDYRVQKLLTIDDYIIESKNENTPKIEKITLTERKERLASIFDNNTPILQVKNLEKIYISKFGFLKRNVKSTHAVKNISFEVYKGETLGLVGESGCGKSTLGKTILGIIKPNKGQILYKGKDVHQLKGKALKEFQKKVQIIFQDPFASLNPKISIGEAIMEPMKVHGIGRSDKERKLKAADLLEKVGLDAVFFNRYPHEFSGGQRQRICIARTLAVEPEFVICDESVSALDVSVQAQVLNLLNDLKTEFNFTYIFISHDLSVVKFMSDRMIVMNKGIIEEMGEADAVYNSPITEYTKELIDSIPKGI